MFCSDPPELAVWGFAEFVASTPAPTRSTCSRPPPSRLSPAIGRPPHIRFFVENDIENDISFALDGSIRHTCVRKTWPAARTPTRQQRLGSSRGDLSGAASWQTAGLLCLPTMSVAAPTALTASYDKWAELASEIDDVDPQKSREMMQQAVRRPEARRWLRAHTLDPARGSHPLPSRTAL
jgi:hypothetical protein